MTVLDGYGNNGVKGVKSLEKAEIQEPTNEIFVNDQILNVNKTGSKIVEFYKDKCVFVTGATGFLGKILVEKLLRACNEIQTIYILIRDKKGKDIHTRMDEIYNDVVSESFRICTKTNHSGLFLALLALFVCITFTGIFQTCNLYRGIFTSRVITGD